MSSARSRPRRKTPSLRAAPSHPSPAQSSPAQSSIAKSWSDRSASPRRGVRSAATTAPSPLLALVTTAIADMKAIDVKVLNVQGLTDIADYMVVASGSSDRHVKSIAERVVQQAKAAGKRPFGVEGQKEGEWVLVDLPDIMVHLMLPRVREFYALEELWDSAPRVKAAAPAPAAKRTRAAGKRPTGAGVQGKRRRVPATTRRAPRKV